MYGGRTLGRRVLVATTPSVAHVGAAVATATTMPPRRGGGRSLEISPELCEQLLSMDPNEAVAELLDQGLSKAEAQDLIMQLRQEASVTAELANTLLSLPPHEAVELLMQTPGIQEGGMTATSMLRVLYRCRGRIFRPCSPL